MLRDLMLDACHTRLASITANYRLAFDEHSADGVHDLRVDLKRMRALFDMVEALNNGFRAKQAFKQFRGIAKHTSALRDVQVQRDVIASLAADPGAYAAFLHERENAGWRVFGEFDQT